jgi:DNA oxidative demethylase
MMASDALPVGFEYRPDLLTVEEERRLVALLHRTEFGDVRLRGQVARRRVRHFGFTYDYRSRGLTPAEPLPEELRWCRDRAASLAAVAPAELEQVLATRYPPGAGIGWHRDAPTFGEVIVGISLLGACRMRFELRRDGERALAEQQLGPRSGYVLSGPARWAWRHHIPPVPELRYSLTFRTLGG